MDADADLSELDRPRPRRADAPGPRTAPLVMRVLSALIDAALGLAVVAFFALMAEVLYVRTEGRISVPVEHFALAWLVFGWLIVVGGDCLSAATPGRRVMSLRVRRPDGAAAGRWRPIVRRLVFDLRVLGVAGAAFWLMLRRQGLLLEEKPDLGVGDAAVFAAFAVNLFILLSLLKRVGKRRGSWHEALSGTLVLVVDADQPPPPAPEPVAHPKPRRLLKQREPAPVVPDYLRSPDDPEPRLEERPPRPRVFRDRPAAGGVADLDHPHGVDAPRSVFGRLGAAVVARFGFRSEIPEPVLPGEVLPEAVAPAPSLLYALVDRLVAPARAVDRLFRRSGSPDR